MNSILESADPGRVNGFLAAFPDRGFGTAEFFSVPWPFWPKRAFPGDGLEVSGRRVREFRNDFWENSHGRSQEGNKKIHNKLIREYSEYIIRIHKKQEVIGTLEHWGSNEQQTQFAGPKMAPLHFWVVNEFKMACAGLFS